MAATTRQPPVFYDAALVEEAVMLAEPGLSALLRLRFRQERDRLYGLDDIEARDLAFERFHQRWFATMDLGGPVTAALEEHGEVVRRTRRAIVLPAATAADEGADLRDERRVEDSSTASPTAGGGDGRPTIVLQLRARTLVDRGSCGRLLAHELLHLADILDPAFGYRKDLVVPAAGPSGARRVVDRYRVLWDCTVDGRLYRLGRVGEDVAAARRREFEACFPEIGRDVEREFRRWFDQGHPTHDTIAAAARQGASATGAGVCPLCSFPYADLPIGMPLRAETLALIRDDFPVWEPEQGICRQCRDIYDARSPMPPARVAADRGVDATGRAGP